MIFSERREKSLLKKRIDTIADDTHGSAAGGRIGQAATVEIVRQVAKAVFRAVDHIAALRFAIQICVTNHILQMIEFAPAVAPFAKTERRLVGEDKRRLIVVEAHLDKWTKCPFILAFFGGTERRQFFRTVVIGRTNCGKAVNSLKLKEH
uniref:Uncharacterized protein n=1 Tax=Romanomermis culicivorax TaxID=13658 RepID=A0A915J7A7_ROMCU